MHVSFVYLHYARREIQNGGDRGGHHLGHHHNTQFSNLDTFGERKVLLEKYICYVVRMNSIYYHKITLGVRKQTRTRALCHHKVI